MTYLTFDVLEFFMNWTTDPSQVLARSMTALDNDTGAQIVKTRTTTPVAGLSGLFTLEDRVAVTAFRAFLDARRGRAIPVWVPTRQADLTATHTLSSGNTALTVEHVGYTDSLFPHNARKHVALITADWTIYTRGVSGSVDNGNGTETLTLNASVPVDVVMGQSLISFLAFCRLSDDEALFEWLSDLIADVRLNFTELPREAPAP